MASRAEELGLDGVFCFDHLWPMDQPGRPAIAAWPLLGALVATTRTITIGTLVARIGLLPDDATRGGPRHPRRPERRPVHRRARDR